MSVCSAGQVTKSPFTMKTHMKKLCIPLSYFGMWQVSQPRVFEAGSETVTAVLCDGSSGIRGSFSVTGGIAKSTGPNPSSQCAGLGRTIAWVIVSCYIRVDDYQNNKTSGRPLN